ncbi:hypothetical protein GGS24DRAFT_505101 [Hypoxylon argillaceum]|nr:hypothetical protein GGS24DRAFT_505101 [Hypoxylon argillaceum]
MPSNKQKSGQLDKKERQVFTEYLENANASLAHIACWKGTANPIHGEGRRTTYKGETFHVEAWQDRDGSYKSRVMIGKKGSSKRVLENSELNHGFDEPTIAEVINAHKRQYGIDDSSPTPTGV